MASRFIDVSTVDLLKRFAELDGKYQETENVQDYVEGTCVLREILDRRHEFESHMLYANPRDDEYDQLTRDGKLYFRLRRMWRLAELKCPQVLWRSELKILFALLLGKSFEEADEYIQQVYRLPPPPNIFEAAGLGGGKK